MENGFEYFKEGNYRKNATARTILRWLKLGYTVEKIKIAATEIGVTIEQSQVEEALTLYHEWKNSNPERTSTTYKKTKEKLDNRGINENGGR